MYFPSNNLFKLNLPLFTIVKKKIPYKKCLTSNIKSSESKKELVCFLYYTEIPIQLIQKILSFPDFTDLDVGLLTGRVGS